MTNQEAGEGLVREARAPAFYLERVYGEGDARRALTEAEFVLASVRKAFGMVSE